MPFKDPEQRREYERRWYAERRQKWFEDKCCARCGATEDLQLDHIDRTTKVTHRIWTWSKARQEEELAKCQVLCEPCHLEKSIESGDLQHRAILTPEEVDIIRTLKGTMTQKVIGEQFGVSQQCINDILTNRKWHGGTKRA